LPCRLWPPRCRRHAQLLPQRLRHPADVDAWLASADKAMAEQTVKSGHAQWVYQTYVNDDTAQIVADSDAAGTLLQVAQAKQAAAFAKVPGLSPETLRRLTMIRTGITSPAPSTPGAAEEFSSLQAHIQGIYATGHATRGGVSISGHEVENAMITDRNPDELKEMWLSWHDSVGAPMKADYARMVAFPTRARASWAIPIPARLWRGNYDMTPDEFAAMTEKVWGQVRPLYQQFTAMCAASSTRNMATRCRPRPARSAPTCWATCGRRNGAASTIIVAPQGAGDIGYDLTSLLKAKGYDPIRMVKTGEQFYTSLGFRRCPPPSGSVRSSPSRATAKWCAMPRPGTSTTRTTCA
jgi:peptidyl-dipeptidase A